MTRTALKFLPLLLLTQPVLGADYQDAEEVAPESAQDSSVGLQRFEDRDRGPSRAVLRDMLDDAPPFWRDTRGSFNFRMFDFQRDENDRSIQDALAAGFELGIRSGKWRDALSFELSWHTSYAIRAPEDKGGSGILQPDQTDISVLSRAFGQWSINDESRLRLGRQDFNMPYINRQDSRMIPTTYEAYVFQHIGQRLNAVVGHITRVKKRDSEDFVPMSRAAGVDDSSRGTSVLGLQYEWPSGFRLGVVAQRTRDLFTTAYSETSYSRAVSEHWGFQLAAQLSNQWSTGEELLGNFNTHAWGFRGRLSYRGAVLTLAETRSSGTEIRSPFGGNPSYTDPMLGNFDRAGESAYRVGLSQNFAAHGRPGISISIKYTRGRDAVQVGNFVVTDPEELDVTADFRPEKGKLKGVWLRLRWGRWDRGDGLPEREDWRVILNYTMSAFD